MKLTSGELWVLLFRAPRRTWSDLSNAVPDRMFKRMFRMNKPSFERLCSKICDKVGEDEFKSEVHLSSRQNPRTYDATMSAGGVIPGEIKVAKIVAVQ